MIHDFDQVCDLLVLCCLNEPLSEVALDSHMEHLFLLACQSCCLNFTLDLSEFLRSKLHHLDEFLWTKEET